MLAAALQRCCDVPHTTEEAAIACAHETFPERFYDDANYWHEPRWLDPLERAWFPELRRMQRKATPRWLFGLALLSGAGGLGVT